MYQKDVLKEYINNSELRKFSKDINVRMSKKLSLKYDKGSYNNYLNTIQKCFDIIKLLKIEYPGNAHPILYIYIVPDDKYVELLNFPKIFDRGKGGGRPVKCYDLDGFYYAYGLSQNILENAPEEETNISKIENNIHELAHIINSQFSYKNQTIQEGFAEALALYGLDFEKKFDEHRNAIVNLDKTKIITAQELLNSEKNGTYGSESISLNKSCSFRYSYISSYLLVRGCIEILKNNNNYTKEEAIQKFLEILKGSNCTNEWLIFDIANAIGIDKDKLLNSKEVQIYALNSIINN